MLHRARIFVLFAVVVLSVAGATGQTGATKTLNGFVTIKANAATAAILGKKDAASAEGVFLFCVDLAKPAPQTIEFSGPARLIYRPQPLPPGMPAGVTISGPESVSSTLGVVADNGKAWMFVAKGEKAVLPPGDPALANAINVNVTVVRRLDWASGNGPRRGTEMEGCLAPAG
jgi:hypothetical protein